MNPNPPFVVILLGFVALAGCTGDEAVEEESLQCHIRTCIADPDGNDAQEALQRYGLHQVTGDAYDKYFPRVEGDLVVWQSVRIINETNSDDVYAYDAESGELLVVGADDFVHQILPHLSQGHVVYSESPASDSVQGHEFAYLVLWDASSQEKQRLDIPVVGSKGPSAFDYPWILFHNRGAPDPEEEGLYAFNVEDERLVQVYIPYPKGEKPDGTFEIIRGEAVADGHAYYAVFRNDFNETTNSTIYDVDLETGEERVVYYGDGWQIDRLDADSSQVAWAQEWVQDGRDNLIYSVFLLDAQSMEIQAIVNEAGVDADFPRISGDWLVYHHSGPIDGRFSKAWRGFHVPTQTMHDLVFQDKDLGLNFKVDTDGGKLAIVAYRLTTEFFETQGWDVYWKPLPSVP